MARPKKSEHDKRKNKVFIRLTDAEFNTLKEKINYKEDKNLSELLRNYLFKK